MEQSNGILIKIIIFTIIIFFLAFFNYQILLIIALIILPLLLITIQNNWKFLLIPLTLIAIISANHKPQLTNLSYNHQAKISEIYDNSVIVEENNKSYYLIIDNSNNLTIGDELSYTGYYQPIEENNSFNYFLWSNSCCGYLIINDNYEIINYHHNTLRNRTFNNLRSEDNLFDTYSFTFLYGNSNGKNQYLINGSTKLGVSFLIVVSGFHINLVMNSSEKLCNYKFSQRQSKIITFILTSYFLYFLYFPITGLRAFLTKILNDNSNLSAINSLSLTAIIFFIYNPYFVFSIGIWLSFLITAGIYLLPKHKNKFLNNFNVSISSFIISLPLITTLDSEINLLEPLLAILLIPIICFLYYLIIIFLILKFFRPLIIPLFWLINFWLIKSDFFFIAIPINALNLKEIIFWETIIFSELNCFKEQQILLIAVLTIDFLTITYNFNNGQTWQYLSY